MDIKEIELKFKSRSPRIIDTTRENAVLLPLVENEKGLCILYETRAMNIWQPGEVCFPGGGIEEGETAAATVIRETVEEIGVKASDIQLISQFDTIIGVSGFVLKSFIGKINTNEYNLEPKEVAEVFTVPIDWLIKNEPDFYSFPVKIEIPKDFSYSVVGIEGDYKMGHSAHTMYVWNYEGHYIWGLTAKITKEFIKLIV